MTWGLSKLSRVAPVFFCPARGAPEPEGKELWLGVGLLKHRGGLGGSWAGKLALNQRDVHYFSPSPWKAKWELVALIFSSKPGPRALSRQRWRGDPS